MSWVSTSGSQGIPRGLDCNNGACSPGDKLQVWHLTGAGGQQWGLSTSGALSSGGLCVDGALSPVAPAACTGSASQTWGWNLDSATGLHQLKNQGTGTCLDVQGGTDADGTPMQLYDCASSWTRWQSGLPLFQLKNPGSVISICISPIDGKLYGVGTDHNTYTRGRNATGWTLLGNPCCVSAIEFCGGQQLNGVATGGTINGVATAQQIYYKSSTDPASSWVWSANTTKLIDVAWNPLTNVQWGIGTDNKLYFNSANHWTLQGAGVTGIIAISIANGGRQWVVGTDHLLYYQTGTALNTSGDFTQVPGTSGIISVACDRFSSLIYVVRQDNTVTTASVQQTLAASP